MKNIINLQSRKLLRYGILLFLLGLITGFLVPLMKNPRMGLTSHLEGIENGMFLLLIGLIWSHLRLPKRILTLGYYLSLFGTYTNWATTFLAGVWGAGSKMMPITGTGYHAKAWQEGIIKFGLLSLSFAMIFICVIFLWGLWSPESD